MEEGVVVCWCGCFSSVLIVVFLLLSTISLKNLKLIASFASFMAKTCEGASYWKYWKSYLLATTNYEEEKTNYND